MDFLLDSYVTGGRIKLYFTADTDKTGRHVDRHRLTDWLRGHRQAKTDRQTCSQTYRQSDRQYVLDFVHMLTSIAGLTFHIYILRFVHVCTQHVRFPYTLRLPPSYIPAKWAD